MTLSEKPDSARFRKAISRLKREPWLGDARKWWPSFLFHFTDVQNVVSILKSGSVVSRARLLASGLPFVDGASPDIIEHTDSNWLKYVRLYFRPRTPTQYRNEGIRPHDKRLLGGAHYPVPVYLLFDSPTVLIRGNSQFTDGNLAAGAVPYGSAADFEKMPFELIYHDSSVTPDQRSTIVYHRHAEVIVPDELDLSGLRQIFCRSQAEYQTLLHLLPPGVRSRWSMRVGTAARLNLFFRRWTFIEEVSLSNDVAVFRFNPGTETPGPFAARAEIVETSSKRKYLWSDPALQATGTLRIHVGIMQRSDDYLISLFLDDCLAYAGRYQEEPLPF